MKISDCDKFGAQVHLMHDGQASNGTLCGGVVTLLLKGLTLGFFCMRMIALTKFDDPSINNYVIYEDRSKMKEPINFGASS